MNDTIIAPTRRAPRLLETPPCLTPRNIAQHMKSARHPPFEYIDHCSTDRSRKIAEANGLSDPRRLRWRGQVRRYNRTLVRISVATKYCKVAKAYNQPFRSVGLTLAIGEWGIALWPRSSTSQADDVGKEWDGEHAHAIADVLGLPPGVYTGPVEWNTAGSWKISVASVHDRGKRRIRHPPKGIAELE
jgi:hypothetical protein